MLPLYSLEQVEWRISGCLHRAPTAWAFRIPAGPKREMGATIIVIMSGPTAVEQHGT
jgi:hypothetical protein